MYGAVGEARSVAMSPRDFSDVLKGAPAGEWIALTSNKEKMIAYGKTVEEVLAKAKELGVENPFLLRMPMPNLGIAASNS